MSSNHLPVSGGMTVVVAMIVSYFVLGSPVLEDFRPAAEKRVIEQNYNLEPVRARLWQDPFAAVAEYMDKQKPDTNQVTIFLDNYIPEKHPTSEPKRKESVEPAKEEAARSSTDSKKEEFTKPARKEIFDVLAVMVPAGPYAELAERRKRMRYAVLTALGFADYQPKDEEHIGFVQVNIDGAMLTVPFEIYVKKSLDKKTLKLVWLDEDAFRTHPLRRLNILFRSFRAPGKRALIGPYYSGTLKKMVEEEEGDFSELSGIKVYAATATAPDDYILGGKENKKTSDGKNPCPGQEEKQTPLEKFLGNSNVFKCFHRTIATDDVLMKAVSGELSGKRISPFSDIKDYHIAIVSEWDTDYGRSLASSLKNAANLRDEAIYYFTYMRGLDGALPARRSLDKKDTKNTSGEKKSENDSARNTTIERPEGRSQKDYLRRLAADLYRLHLQLEASGEQGIHAIGVLGSDVYDKLLVLRVLRERFPKALFFTTDLDATFLHPLQFRWTRSVIVASAYGLLPDTFKESGKTKRIPPFRDSYQTSMFNTVRMALDNAKDSKIVNKDEAKIFEIGRDQAIELSGGHDYADWAGLLKYWLVIPLILFLVSWFVWPKYREKIRLPALLYADALLVGVLAETGVFQHWEVWPNCWLMVLLFLCLLAWFVWLVCRKVICLLVVGFFAVTMLAQFEIVELWWQGLAVAALLIVFCAYALFCMEFSVRRGWEEMDKRTATLLFMPGHAAFWGLLIFVCAVWVGAKDEPFLPLSGISIWPGEFIRLMGVWLAIFLICRGWRLISENGREISDWLCAASFEDHVRQAWIHHCEENTLSHFFHRCWLPMVIWLFLCLWILLLQWPHVPFRGYVAFGLDALLSALISIVMVVIVGFVVDSSLRCHNLIGDYIKLYRRWEEELAKGGSLIEHRHILQQGWEIIQLIARRTEVVSRTVYYPVYVILLLVLAQIDYFDNWDMPYTLVLVAGMNSLIAFASAILLRRRALEFRGCVLSHLRKVEEKKAFSVYRGRAYGTNRGDALAFCREQVEQIHEGAFKPIAEQPWLRALTLMFGGGSSLLLLQYLGG